MTTATPSPLHAGILRRGYDALKARFVRRLTRLIVTQPGWPAMVHTWVEREANRPVSDSRVRVGEWTYGIFPRCVFMAREEDRLTVGKFCSIAEGVRFIYGNHPVDAVSTYPLRTVLRENWLRNVDAVSRGPIVVGNDVWIASDAIILSGVTIGDGAVIGAGSVVTRDVAPYSLSAGVPARHLRFRHTEPQIAKLLQIRWWDWPNEKIMAHLDEFYGNVDAFIERFAPTVPS